MAVKKTKAKTSRKKTTSQLSKEYYQKAMNAKTKSEFEKYMKELEKYVEYK